MSTTTMDRQLDPESGPHGLLAATGTDEPVILHSDRGTQFTSYEYQQFLKDHHITLSMSDVGHCGDLTPRPSGFFGMLKRERVMATSVPDRGRRPVRRLRLHRALPRTVQDPA